MKELREKPMDSWQERLAGAEFDGRWDVEAVVVEMQERRGWK